jgi:tRNA nucleotidyltransferase (CCA-adding enzyme)
VVEHPRFATAKAVVGGVGVDLAAARAESYERPGALPEVRPAQIGADLARRDFTVNAMALSLGDERRLIDPHGGLDDLAAGRLRVLHEASFRDDPTRALRAARYAARFGFQPEPETLRLLVATDLDTVSADRQRAELLRICAEPAAPQALRLLDEWGVLEMAAGAPALCESVAELLSGPPWNGTVARAEALLAALEGPGEPARGLAAADPDSPSQAVELASGAAPTDLVLARALGGAWLDRYVTEWRGVETEIAGEDLIAAGVPQGPAVGRGLRAALRAKLDGEVSGREAELRIALDAARAEEA